MSTEGREKIHPSTSTGQKEASERELNMRASAKSPSYPSVSDLAGGNSDHDPSKAGDKTQTTPDSVLTRARRNSDHGLSLGRFWGRGRRGGSQTQHSKTFDLLRRAQEEVECSKKVLRMFSCNLEGFPRAQGLAPK